MTNKELISIANMELRDQLEAERVKVKKYKKLLKECQLLLFDNGFTFDKEDRKKCVDLLARLSEVL